MNASELLAVLTKMTEEGADPPVRILIHPASEGSVSDIVEVFMDDHGEIVIEA